MVQLEPGMQAPDFSGVIETGDSISLSDFKGKKLILFFYPKDGTPGCTAEACNLRDHYEELTQKGFELLGVSPDSAKKHTGFIAKHELPFHLLADTDQAVLKAYGAWGEKQMYGKTYEGVLRSTYVIDEEGVIAAVFNKVKTKTHAEQILEELG